MGRQETGLPPSQRDVIDRGAVVAGIAGGLVAFGVTGLLLLDSASIVTHAEVVGWAVACSAWLLSWLPFIRSTRGFIQVASVLSLLALPVVLGPWTTPIAQWIPSTTVAFAATVVAAFALRWRPAIVAVLIATALEAWLSIERPPLVVVMEPVFAAGLAGALLTLVCGLLLVVVHTRWVAISQEMDDDVALLAELQNVTEREAHLLQLRASVDRRIHETVLNTLTALSADRVVGDSGTIAAACRRDCEELANGVRQWQPARVAEVIADAISVVDAGRTDGQLGVSWSVDRNADPVLSAGAAGALRDALVEALRNVQRHAGVREAVISTDEHVDAGHGATDVIVCVQDQGVGIPAASVERFGMHEAIRGNMTAIGGRAEVHSSPGNGTLVRLVIPLSVTDGHPLPDITVDGAIERSFAARIGLACAVIFAAVIAVPMGMDVGWSTPLPWLMVLDAAVNVGLAWWWNTRARRPMAFLALGVTGLGMASGCAMAVSLGTQACRQAPGLIWLQSAFISGGLLLIMLAFRSTLARMAVLAYGVGLGVALVFALPQACADDALVPLVTGTLYLILIALVVEWGQRRVTRGLQQAREIRGRVQADRMAMDAQAARVAGWSRVNADILPLLAGVANGSLAVEDPRVRARAGHEAAALRGLLGREPARRGPATHLIASMMEIAVHIDCTIDAEVLSATVRQDLLPVPVQDLVMGLVAASSSSAVGLRVLVDDEHEEYLLAFPRQVGAAAPEVFAAEQPRQIEDCIIEAFSGSDDAARVSIRRPFSIDRQPRARESAPGPGRQH